MENFESKNEEQNIVRDGTNNETKETIEIKETIETLPTVSSSPRPRLNLSKEDHPTVAREHGSKDESVGVKRKHTCKDIDNPLNTSI
jgi:hypothetical protein